MIEFSRPNQFEHMMREEGLREDVDIWDIDTLEDIRSEIAREEKNIQEAVDRQLLTPEKEQLLKKIHVFTEVLANSFKQQFLFLLEEYERKHRKVPQQIIDFILEQNFVFPEIKIVDAIHAQETLEGCGFPSASIPPDNFLVVFQLPKPIARFWWKGGYDRNGAKVDGMFIRWGEFYKGMMYVVWDTRDNFEREYDVTIDRINEEGEHDAKKYYYLWNISSGSVDDDKYLYE